jgi:hypothetical protein
MIIPYFHPHMKEKHKKKLTVLLGYQLSNLGWIGAWTSYGHWFFIPCVMLICAADVLIIWKEL